MWIVLKNDMYTSISFYNQASKFQATDLQSTSSVVIYKWYDLYLKKWLQIEEKRPKMNIISLIWDHGNHISQWESQIFPSY